MSKEKMIIRGGNSLNGTVTIEGAKNAVLPIQAATILASEGKVILKNVPNLSDVHMMDKVLNFLNVEVKENFEENELVFDATNHITSNAPFKYVSKMRASMFVMGPLLARTGRAHVAMPGGCAIGSRPVDLHLKGFEAMGAIVEQSEGYIDAKVDKLHGADIYLDFPSVGATENIMMAATLAEGTTVIRNVAREPEIVDLAIALKKMGADISGEGTEIITVNGVPSLHGCEHEVVQDRIVAGTFMIASAITNGNILIKNAIADHNGPLISKLQAMGVTVKEENGGIRVIGSDNLKPVDITTAPYPGFPTDMQAQMSVLQLTANGISNLTENIFENRFKHLDELRRMNADFSINGRTALLKGPVKYSGAEVAATDLRAAAALILAGLAANGYSVVTELHYLDRGYVDFKDKLKKLGADIYRVDESVDLQDFIKGLD
ncbi:MAG: UDP-N-acetylglucosamine 1-carboxyvinyltransferase [Firmicutes bacterium]|uniref:UDP-N-acetylglucosamine 1-carboxyvinyltransferase n=1 Tax=Candidatus Gallilactobacillus intestinavium TaxID=2840838 RepID=A0A9D9E801_9LACO|nr:UDP-N-acetylglucosamine 1-carboxyvinyltransferase [Candidatus Gallilactobacillus intestinavium]